ncbi:MAG: hypothetical protein WD734_00525, partial [Dehalococcoidia bacterium]
ALRAARRNLLAQGCASEAIEVVHRGAWVDNGPAVRASLLLGVLHEGEGPRAVEAEYLGLIGLLEEGGTAVLACTSTAATRLLASRGVPGDVRVTRYRHRGRSVLTARRQDAGVSDGGPSTGSGRTGSS